MSTPNINNAMPQRGISGDSTPVITPAVTVAKSKAAPAEQHAVTAKGTPSPEQLQNMVEKANKAMDKASSNIEFTVDGTTNKTVIKVMEAQSGKVIMQFPSEEMLSITRAIDHAQKGVLLKEKA
jgi:flagellar protein FlaG